MSDLTALLDAIQARREGLGTADWYTDQDGDVSTGDCTFIDVGGDLRTPAFIANAPTDIQDLLDLARKQQAAIDAVRSIHVPVMKDGEPVGCSACDWDHPVFSFRVLWPCPTIKALEAKP